MASNDLKQRVKRDGVLTAGNINNLASLKQILDELYNNNRQAFIYYFQILGQRRSLAAQLKNFHFVTPGHPIKQFDDDWDGDVMEDYFEKFGYKALNPTFISPLHNLEEEDPVTKLLKIKAHQYTTVKRMKMAIANLKRVKKYEKLNEEVVRCPQIVIDIAACLENDPEPYFDSAHNWLYAGNGNMQLICVNWVDYLLHSSLHTMYISEFNKDEISMNSECVRFDCEAGNNILETICSPHLIVTLRTRNKIYILKVVTLEDKLNIEKIKEVDSLIQFTSISYDSIHQNILYITTLDNKLTIVNLDRMTGRTVMLKNDCTTLKNNWNAVMGAQRTHYMHVTGKFITCYDKRTNLVAHSWKDLRDITDEVGCNHITAAKQKEGSTLMYFGTDHHLFLMDMRCTSNSKLNVIQRWTHGMQSVPVYISSCNFEFNKDLLCLSSQWCEDMCVVSNYNDVQLKDTQGVMIPYRPPSITDTFNAAKQKLLCWDLYNPIDSRLYTSITGNIIMEHGEKYLILMQNSLGDITSHVLYPEHLEMYIEDESSESLNEWSKNYKMHKKPLEVSSIVDIGPVWKKLKKVTESHTFTTEAKTRFREKDIFDMFENEEIEVGLLDIWVKESPNVNKENTLQESSMFLHFSDSE